MAQHYIITDKSGNFVREGDFTEPEMRLIARAGYRVFENRENEITPQLTGLFTISGDSSFPEFK